MKTVITLTRLIGCGGSYIGERLARQLKFRHLDRAIPRMAAQELGLTESGVAGWEEKATRFRDLFKEMLLLGPTEGLFAPPPLQAVPEESIHAKECMVMTTAAEESDCVIVGRGAAAIFRDCDSACHILLHAPMSFRIHRVMHYYHAKTEKEARRLILRSDHERAAFMKRVHEMNGSDPGNYHLCIDTSRASLNDIVTQLAGYIQLWRQRKTARSRPSLRYASSSFDITAIPVAGRA